MFQFVDDIKKLLRNCNDILRYSYDDRKYMENQFNKLQRQNREIMSQTEAAVDQLISIVVPLIESSRTLATALDAANARAVASAAELAEFISTDAEEDARQLAQQDANLAAGINDKAAKLAADIAAIQNPPVVEASPGEGEPAETVDEPEVATEGEDEAVRTDEGSATDDATVEVVEDPAASEVITPEANAPESQEEFDAENR